MAYSSANKLKKITQNLCLKMNLKIKVSKFFFSYLANYLLLRPTTINFAVECVSEFENIVFKYIANITRGNYPDPEFLLFLLVITHEIYMQQFCKSQQLFSVKFLKFLRNLDFFYDKYTWADLLRVLKSQSVDQGAFFFFFDPHYERVNNFYNKRLIESVEDTFMFLMQVGFFLLQQSHQIVLNNFIFVNSETSNYPVSKLITISTFMEKSIDSVYATNQVVNNNFQFQTIHPLSNIKFALSVASQYLPLSDKDCLLELSLLCKSLTRHFLKLFCRRILSESITLLNSNRKILYQKLMVLEVISFYDSVAHSNNQKYFRESSQDISLIIKMDVERTKFFEGDPEELKQLLLNLSDFVPTVGYYQGLNCIGAFLLEYFSDFAFGFDVISFILHKQLKQYFFGDFSDLNKLVFIGDSLMAEMFPEVYYQIEKSAIGHGFYLSSVILTVYFSSLQFCACHQFLLQALDIFMAEGWTGFFKVIPLYLI